MLSDFTKQANEIKEIFKKFKNAEERPFYVVALVLATIITLQTVITAILINQPDPERFGINDTIGGISNQFFTQITPSDWAFRMFSILLTWQGVWVIYAWTLSFRKSFPLTVSTNFLILFSFANVSLIGWCFVSGNRLPQFAFPLFCVCVILLYTGLGYQTTLLYKLSYILTKQRKFKIDFFLTRIVLINGVSAYVSWLDFVLLINLAEALQFFTPLSAGAAGTIGLTLLVIKLLIYFNLEMTILDPYLRYVFAPYPITIWGLSAIIDIQDADQPNTTFSVVLLSLSIFLLTLKIVLVITFNFIRPLVYPDENNNVSA